MAFDKSKVFATVHGDRSGASFSQNGLLFSEDGNVITDHETYDAPTRAKAKAHAEADAAKPAEDDAEDASLIDFNFKAWALGNSDATFAEAKAAIKEKYGVAVKSTAAGVQLLIDKGVVEEADVKG